jgi:serine protease Do
MNRSSLLAAAGVFAFAVAVYFLVPSATSAESAMPMQAEPLPAGKVPRSMGEVSLTFAPVVKRVAPAVVNVYSRSVVQAPAMNPFFNDPLFQRFFGVNPQMRQRVQQSLGSGVIVRPDGMILTNNHVIEGGQDIVVALSDKREFKAKVILADQRTDLAVLKIDTKGEKLPTVDFGDSDRLQVGDLVLAIGDPFGVGQTVTMGIVSALARTEVGASNYQFFIQTDAAINPGNSGGALVTTDGKLAGINSAIYSRTGESVGIGFAIPANLARRVVDGAQSGGIKLPWIGADGQAVTGEIAASLGLPRPEGVLLKDIFPGGPAAQAGLKTGDVILSIDGVAVSDMQSLNYRVATHKPGDTVKAQIASHGRVSNVAVKLALPPAGSRDGAVIGGHNPLTGARVETLSPAVAVDLQMDLMAKGVVIRAVSDNSLAAGYGFQPGDIVRAVNGQVITSTGQLQHVLNAGGSHWDMVIDRGGQRMNLSVDG